ncbi:hypothetical protein IWQ61_000129 [Dispira simplex]|nr:hypothetical protein IWQ61_000129 [Dispira simplex]
MSRDRLQEFQVGAQQYSPVRTEAPTFHPYEHERQQQQQQQEPFHQQPSQQWQQSALVPPQEPPPPQQYEMNTLNNSDGSLFMFHQETLHVERLIDLVSQKLDNIDKLNQRTLQAVGEEQIKRCQSERDHQSEEIDQDIQTTQQALEKVTNENQQLPATSSEAQSRRGKATALTRKFQEVIAHYQDVENAYLLKSRDRLRRQYKVARPLASDDEIEQAMDEERAGQVFTQSLLMTNRMGDARRVVYEVESRQQEMRTVEKKVLELNALFIRLNEMLHAQQEVMDNIDVHVNETLADTTAANQQVGEAITSRKRIRKKLWIVLIIIILIIIAVVLAVTLSVT